MRGQSAEVVDQLIARLRVQLVRKTGAAGIEDREKYFDECMIDDLALKLYIPAQDI
jgi:hypothetical protein